jgi:virginiamycin B lyase
VRDNRYGIAIFLEIPGPDPKTESFESVPLPDSYASVRQLAGRKGEVWGAESAADKLFIIKSE